MIGIRFSIHGLAAGAAALLLAPVVLARDPAATGSSPLAEWVDFDRDGDLDLFLARPSSPPRLLANLGDGSFEDATERAGLAGLPEIASADWTDNDGDGRADLLIVARDGTLRCFRGHEEGGFEETTLSAGLDRVHDATAASWLDFDRDGRLDLFVRGAASLRILHNLGEEQFESVPLGLEPSYVEPEVSGPAIPSGVRSIEPCEAPEVPPSGTAQRPSGARNSPAESLAGDDRRSPAPSGDSPQAGSGGGLLGFICADQLRDQATGNCIRANSLPEIGTLYPLSEAFNLDPAGRVGIGTLVPRTTVDVAVGEDASLFGGGFVRIGAAQGQSLVLDDDEIMARDGAQPSPLHLQDQGGDLIVGANASGATPPTRVGLGTGTPASQIHAASAGSSVLTLEADVDGGDESDVAGVYFSKSGGDWNAWFGFNDNNTLELDSSAGFMTMSTFGTSSPNLILGPEGICGMGSLYNDVALNIGSEHEVLLNVHSNATGALLRVSQAGWVATTGDLYVSGSKNFRIDHPLDPANKILQHSCVESSEPANVYGGTVLLDARGEAVVHLPDYFEALNVDHRYQLTSVGAPAPMLHVADEIADNRFRIAGGAPGAKVSWLVTGLRNDPWFRDHPYQDVLDKRPEDRGKYYYPAGYGAPRSASIFELEELESPGTDL